MINFCPRYVDPRIIIRRVPRGTRGTLVTARLIAQMVREGAKDFDVRQKAIENFRDYGDMTILLGAMLMSTGHPVRLALVGFRPDKPHVYSHIYPEVNVRGRWMPIDATVDQPIGWAPPALWKRICEIEREDLKCSSKTR